MKKINVSVIGASGFAGGELLRLLLFHPYVNIIQATSERFIGKSIHKVHPNLRGISNLKFSSVDDLHECDLLFLCLPHSKTMNLIDRFMNKSERIIDLSGDFRLNIPEEYERWYGAKHVKPELLSKFIYGIPELHREDMQDSKYISSAGCNATAVILALYPLYKENLVYTDRTVVDIKAASSEAGNAFNEGSHHPVRHGSLRVFKAVGHRHSGEINQELSFNGEDGKIHLTATSVNIIRGVQAASSVFLNRELSDKDLWKLYRKYYGKEPFVRIVKEREGIIRLPDPKILAGTNFCDIGFVKDPDSDRVVIISAIDNLMKGAAGQALQAFNIMNGIEETTGLTFPGLYPV